MTPPTETDTAHPDQAAPTLLPRRTIRLSRGEVAYVDHGRGGADGASDAPAALFVHGVLVNADLWRNVIWDVADVRRCIAPDLPAHGATPVPRGPGGRSVPQRPRRHARRALRGARPRPVDVVANDTGGAVAQVFAARYPQRIRTLTLTNCDVHDNFPPEAFKPFVALAASGEFGPMVAAMAGDLALARSEVGFAQGYAHPDQLTDELITSYLAPFVRRPGQGPRTLPDRIVGGRADGGRAAAGAVAGPGASGVGHRAISSSSHRGPSASRDMIPGVERVTLVPRRHAVLARRAGSRPRPAAPGLLGGPRLIERRTPPRCRSPRGTGAVPCSP